MHYKAVGSGAGPVIHEAVAAIIAICMVGAVSLDILQNRLAAMARHYDRLTQSSNVRNGSKADISVKKAPPERTERGSIRQLKINSGNLWRKGNCGRIRFGWQTDISANTRRLCYPLSRGELTGGHRSRANHPHRHAGPT